MDLKREKIKRIIYLILFIIFTIITFIGATFVIVNRGRVNAGFAVIPMLCGLIFSLLFHNSNKKIGEPILKKHNVILPICIILIFGILFGILYMNKEKIILPNKNFKVYDNTGHLIYDSEKENEITEVITDTTIKGIVELNHNGYIYIFNGQHFGEYGFEMKEYTRANIDNKNQSCIDYITNKEYDTTYIEEGDLLICTGDLTVKGNIMYNSDLDTKDNSIIVLKAEDYNNMKKEVLNGKRVAKITVGDYYNTSNEIYLKYSITDKNYQLPFALKLTIADDTEIIGNIEKGKEVKVEYENINSYLDELKLKSIEVIEENDNIENLELEYYVENGIYYTNVEEKTKIISLESACDIADEEAKKDIYQYQSWKSEFYSRGKNNDMPISARLIRESTEANRIDWNEEWQKIDDYKNKIMWEIRLIDNIDPLTSLFVYIDAISGEVLGAESLSD